MNDIFKCLIILLLVGCSNIAQVTTVTGNEKLRFPDSRPELEPAWEPVALDYDSQNSLFFLDRKHRLMKVNTRGDVEIVAGSSRSGFKDGQGKEARFNHPLDLTVASDGTIYVADTGNHAIRKITPDGFVSTLVGGRQGLVNGRGKKASFNRPNALVLDSRGELYVAEKSNHQIRHISSSGVVKTFVSIDSPFSLTIDVLNNLYVSSNQQIVKVSPDKTQTFLTRGHQLFSDLIYHSDGYLIATDTYRHRLVSISLQGHITPITKHTLAGQRDGNFNSVRFNFPRSIALSREDILMVADSNQRKIRQLSLSPSKVVTTLVKSAAPIFEEKPPTGEHLGGPRGIAFDQEGHLYIADYWNHRILKQFGDGTVEVVAEDALKFQPLDLPSDVILDRQGNLYIADSANHQIRKISPNGDVSIVAGSGERGFRDAQGASAQFNLPLGLSLDQQGNLYVADTGNHCIRKVLSDGQVITLSGTGQPGFRDGSPASAQFHYPTDLTLDISGNIYVADYYNHRIRQINFNGQTSTVAGGDPGFKDGVGSEAKFYSPQGITVDHQGNLYVSDSWNHRIRKISPERQVSSLAGLGRLLVNGGGFADGDSNQALFDEPRGLAIGPDRALYIADTKNNKIRRVELNN